MLGFCMLCAIFDNEMSESLMTVEVERIKSAHELFRGSQEANPVIKIKSVINPVADGHDVDAVDLAQGDVPQAAALQAGGGA